MAKKNTKKQTDKEEVKAVVNAEESTQTKENEAVESESKYVLNCNVTTRFGQFFTGDEVKTDNASFKELLNEGFLDKI